MDTGLWKPRAGEPGQRWEVLGELLNRVPQHEQYWRSFGIEAPPGCVGFLPYSQSLFIMYLSDALTATQGPRFLDVGCGPGTKLTLAHKLFGLDAAGIEIVPAYVDAARNDGLTVLEADARDWDGYDYADIVYVDRPCEDQEQLERHIMKQMRPGGVLISVNGRLTPSDEGWPVVAEEYGAEPSAGVWVKPIRLQ